MATILGLAKLQRKLDRLPGVARATIRAAMEEAANEIIAMMKSLVPVDSGELRDSIGWTWGKIPKGAATIIATAKSSLGGDMTITFFAGDEVAYYARWVEFGTQASAAEAPRQNRNYRRTKILTKGTRGHAATRAQPFFYVSWRANKKSAKRKINAATRKAAKQVAAG